jgi:hypothetical protein
MQCQRCGHAMDVLENEGRKWYSCQDCDAGENAAETKLWRRCPACNATGRLPRDRYCTCQMGRELRQQEVYKYEQSYDGEAEASSG